jgi:hypothetical protein
MEIDQILTECVNHHDSGGDRFGEPDRAPEILGQALVSDPAEVLEQCPVKLEVGPEHLGQARIQWRWGTVASTSPARNSPKKSTFFWWQEGQTSVPCKRTPRGTYGGIPGSARGRNPFRDRRTRETCRPPRGSRRGGRRSGAGSARNRPGETPRNGRRRSAREEKLSGCGAGRLAPPYRPV